MPCGVFPGSISIWAGLYSGFQHQIDLAKQLCKKTKAVLFFVCIALPHTHQGKQFSQTRESGERFDDEREKESVKSGNLQDSFVRVISSRLRFGNNYQRVNEWGVVGGHGSGRAW